MVRRMKTDAASGGVGRGSRRRGLLLFALLLVVAQVLLFAFLRMRKQDEVARASPSGAEQTSGPTAAKPAAPGSPVPKATALPSSTPEGAHTLAGEPETQPLDGPENQPKAEPNAQPSADAGKDPVRAKQERERRERAERERERRERERAERDRERERARLDAEREKARIEMEKERARIELERAERTRLEAEREKLRLEAERAKLAASQSAPAQPAQPAEAAPPPKPAGSPSVLVVLVSTSAGQSSLTREEIRNIYFGKTTFWPNNTPVRVYNRPASSAAGKKFFRSILGTSAGAFREHWNELQLSGGGIAPATVSSAGSIVARVAGGSGAIGYVLESELPDNVSGVRLIRFK
jgi:hypothetical protein